MWAIIAKVLYSIVADVVLKEATEAWKDGTIKDLASTAVSWAHGEFTDNDMKAKAAKEKLIADAKAEGKEIGKEAAGHIIEKMVQRALKEI